MANKKQGNAISRTALAETLLECKGSFVRMVTFGNQFAKTETQLTAEAYTTEYLPDYVKNLGDSFSEEVKTNV